MSWRADQGNVLKAIRESSGAPGSGGNFPSTKIMLGSRMERPASRERCCYLASHALSSGWRTKAKDIFYRHLVVIK